MKKIYIILLVLVLLSGIGTVAFFVTKKKRDNKKKSPKAPVITPEEKAVITPPKSEVAPSIPRKPFVKESLEMDIKVPYVDISNRSFDYSMHYKGIQHKGAFQDGITDMVHVKKGFGSFVLNQRMNLEKKRFDLKPRVLKDRGISVVAKPAVLGERNISRATKGGAIKVGATTATNVVEIRDVVSLNSDWVDLFIADTQDRILKQLSVNLRTGETTNANIKF